jgi:hypothetical protein
MGLLDHRRTWHYEVSASPKDCIHAFVSAFTGRGGLFAKAKWAVRTNANSATAIYEGRKGLGVVAGILSKQAAQEAETAVGSEVSFNIDRSDGTRAVCSMVLASSGRSGVGGLLGITSDAKFIRPYMQAVADEMLKIDPSAKIQSS